MANLFVRAAVHRPTTPQIKGSNVTGLTNPSIEPLEPADSLTLESQVTETIDFGMVPASDQQALSSIDSALLRTRTLVTKLTADLATNPQDLSNLGNPGSVLKGYAGAAQKILGLVDMVFKHLPNSNTGSTSIPTTVTIPQPELPPVPTLLPTAAPTSAPTSPPTEAPTFAPTPAPTKQPLPESVLSKTLVGEAPGSDLPGSTSTTGVIKTDGTGVTGFFDRTSRQDWYGMQVEAGKIYKLSLDANNAGRDSIQIIQNNYIQNLVKLSEDGESIYFNSDLTGTVHFAVKGSTSLEGKAYTITSELVPNLNAPGYQIDYDLAPSLLPFKSYFDLAAKTLSSIVVGDVPAVASGFKDGFVDDLYVKVMVDNSITGTLLGYAGPEEMRDGSKLPSAADMYTTAAVLGRLGQAQAVDFIVHETMHAMGLGTLWSNLKLLNTSGNYIGANALDAYRQLTGKPGLTSVPVDSGSGHFSESALGNEILTPVIGKNSYVSIVSIGALEDLGYVVDYSHAENFVLPAGVFVG